MESQSLIEEQPTISLPWDTYVRHLPIKRGFDIIFSALILVLTLPILAVVAIAIRLSSKGSVVYAHERIGRGGRPFSCYKFRTMHKNADNVLQEHLNACPSLREEWEQNHKLKNDPRVTPIGKFLRKLSLDEFPQFWNVIIGDMSIVGPRPMVREEIENKIGSKAAKILSVRPGLTGIWQTSGRSNTSYVKRVQLDELYVEHRSLWLDMKLICKTVPSMIMSRGAY
jgi:undecaprenyl-phosphate galactose phosphotransferase